MEPEMARLLAELDPAVYVLDCLPNMQAAEVTERLEEGVIATADPVFLDRVLTNLLDNAARSSNGIASDVEVTTRRRDGVVTIRVIDHGKGIATRYGHMSEILVKVGQSIRIGQTIGKIGSTGRSTGPHLHYETRIEGDAVDPQKFLRAGIRLGNAL